MKTNEIITFNKTERVKTLPLEILSESKTLRNHKRELPRTRPIEHHALIKEIMELISNQNMTPVPGPIYVSSDQSRIEKGKEGFPQDWVFGRLITDMHIQEVANEDHNASIGVAYNERGITLAWGLNIIVCQNMCIMGSEKKVSTYGNNKLSFKAMMSSLESWLKNAQEEYQNDLDFIHQLAQRQMNQEETFKLMGKNLFDAINKIYIEPQADMPGASTQKANLVVRKLIQEVFPKTKFTANDVYQAFTNVITHHDRNLDTRYEELANVSEWFENSEVLW